VSRLRARKRDEYAPPVVWRKKGLARWTQKRGKRDGKAIAPVLVVAQLVGPRSTHPLLAREMDTKIVYG